MRGNQSGRSSERSFEWPDELLEAQRFQIGRNMMPLLLGFPRWVHRRVETIEFVHETRVRRSVSLDFTIPGFALPRLQTPAGERILVPLALLKKEPLRNFDLRDESGNVLPALTREQNGKIASALLISLAEFVVKQAHAKDQLDGAIQSELIEIAVGARADARRARNNLRRPRGSGSDTQRDLLWRNEELRLLATDFAENFVLITPLTAQTGDRRVLKFAYENTVLPMALSPIRTPLRWAGLRAVPFGTRIASLGTAASYHVEVGVPEDLLIVSASLFTVGQDEPLYRERSVARAHLYAQNMPRGTAGFVQLYLSVRSQIVLQTLLASSLTSAVLGVGLIAHNFGVHPSVDALTALVVVLPGVFAAFLARPGEHSVVLRLVSGLRVGILLSALISFVAAGTLAASFSGSFRLLTWSVLLAASLTITLGSVAGYARAIWREYLRMFTILLIARNRRFWASRGY